MGKTALVAQVARAAHGDGAVVLFGHSDEDLGVAYQPWIEVFVGLVRVGDPELVAGLRPAQRTRAWRASCPRSGPTATGSLIRIRNGCCCWKAPLSCSRPRHNTAPVLVVLDDLHWADTASLQLLRHVIARRRRWM